MIFENSGLEKVVVPQDVLQNVMNKNGWVLGGSWDYERMTFDFKYEIPERIVEHAVNNIRKVTKDLKVLI